MHDQSDSTTISKSYKVILICGGSHHSLNMNLDSITGHWVWAGAFCDGPWEGASPSQRMQLCSAIQSDQMLPGEMKIWTEKIWAARGRKTMSIAACGCLQFRSRTVTGMAGIGKVRYILYHRIFINAYIYIVYKVSQHWIFWFLVGLSHGFLHYPGKGNFYPGGVAACAWHRATMGRPLGWESGQSRWLGIYQRMVQVHTHAD